MDPADEDCAWSLQGPQGSSVVMSVEGCLGAVLGVVVGFAVGVS